MHFAHNLKHASWQNRLFGQVWASQASLADFADFGRQGRPGEHGHPYRPDFQAGWAYCVALVYDRMQK